MEYVAGTRRLRVHHGGFLYVRDYFKEISDTTYYKCSLSSRTGEKCPGRGKVQGGNDFEVTQRHNHAADVRVVEKATARAAMKVRAQTTEEPVNTIIVAAQQQLSAAAQAVSPRASDQVRSIRRYRQQVTGARADPATAAEVVVPEDVRLTVTRPGRDPERFLLYDSQESLYEGGRMLIFATDRSLSDLALSCSWYGDGTFKAVPKVFSQLYTIHCEHHGLLVPAVYMLLSGKEQAVYEHAFEVS